MTRSFLIMALFLCVPALMAFSQTEFNALTTSVSKPGERPFVGNERHLQTSPLSTLYANSAFAHGFRHGYDDGFHLADLDVHMGRSNRDITKFKEYEHPAQQYSSSFGEKELFVRGYRAGLTAGYQDSYAGTEFRATARLKAVAAGIPGVLLSTRRSYFDQGFAGGFDTAHENSAPTANVTSEYLEQYCRTSVLGRRPLEYCSGFSRGYLLGIQNRGAKEVASEQPVKHMQ